MDAPQPGNFWKIPFFWEPRLPVPSESSRLTFEPAPAAWLLQAVASVMEASSDESDQAAVAQLGAPGAAAELLAVDAEFFDWHPGWWQRATDTSGQHAGFVLPVLLKPEKYWRDGKCQGSIYYMGVLPGFRGAGYAGELLAQATRTLAAVGCWRIFCDTGATNTPMVAAFRRSGYEERSPWERPLR